MNRGQQVTQGDFLASISAFVSITLPVVQLFFLQLPESVRELFLARDIFTFTSILTLLISLMVVVAYRHNPYIRIPITPWRKWPNTDKSSESNKYPIYLESNTVAAISILIVAVLGSLFIYIGQTSGEEAATTLAFWQSILYMLTIVLSVFIFTSFVIRSKESSDWEQVREERPIRAINLAKEYNAFPELPNIHFVGIIDGSSYLAKNLQTIVRINNDKHYQIITDSNARFLYEVSPFKMPTSVDVDPLNKPESNMHGGNKSS